MLKILSIIIPSYNMERYLPYCLDSLLISHSRNSIEVVIVNDGSEDSTLAIARRYSEEYPELFRVIDKDNGNYGSCINAALPLITGKFVKVLDADDSFDTANFEYFLEFLNGKDVDLVLSDFTWVDSKRNKLKEITFSLGKTILSMDEACIQDCFKSMEMHAVTYRTKLLVDSGYYQTEGISYTDQQWIFAPMVYVRQVGVFNRPVYQYMVGRVGQTINPEVKLRRIKDRIIYVSDMIKQYDTLNLLATREIKEYLDARIFPNIKDIYITYFTHTGKVDRQLVLDFDDNFQKLSEVLYDKLGMSNCYIMIWRQLKNHDWMEHLFCLLFSVIFRLWTKI